MGESPMALIRKLDATAAAQAAGDEMRREMLDSAEDLERRASEMAEAIGRLRSKIN